MKRSDRKIKTVSLSTPQAPLWLLMVVLYAVTLVIVFNVRDSALLKPSVLVVGVGLLIGYGLWDAIRDGRLGLLWGREHNLLALYLIASLIAVIPAVNKRLSFEALAQVCSYLFLFAFAFHYAAEQAAQKVFQRGLIVLTIVCAIVGLAQALSIPEQSGIQIQIDRQVLATFGNATFFGGFIAMMAPIILSRILARQSSAFERPILIVLLIVMAYLLVLTEARSAWVAFLGGIGLFALLNYRSPRLRSLFIAGLPALILLAALLFPSIVHRRMEEVYAGHLPLSITNRFYFYAAGWKAFLASPIIGMGLGNTVNFIPLFRSPDYWITHSEDIVTHIHNEYLQVLAETGLVGFLSFSAFLVACGVRIFEGIAGDTDPTRTERIGYFGAIFACLIDNLTSMNLRTPPIAALFWLLLAFSLRQAIPTVSHVVVALPDWSRIARWIPVFLLAGGLVYYVSYAPNLIASRSLYLTGSDLNVRNDPGYIDYFRRSIAMTPEYPDARYFYGFNLMQQKKFTEGLREIRQVLDGYPTYPKAHLLMAIGMFETGDTIGSFAEIDKELALDTYPQVYSYASIMAGRLNRPEQEFRFIEQQLQKNLAAKQNDFVEHALLRLGVLSSPLNNAAACRSLIMQCVETLPADQSLLLSAGESLAGMGYKEEVGQVLAKISPGPNPTPAMVQRYAALRQKSGVAPK